jgi:hypothetical protein
MNKKDVNLFSDKKQNFNSTTIDSTSNKQNKTMTMSHNDLKS